MALTLRQLNPIHKKGPLSFLVFLLKIDYRAKINEIEGKIPSITGLATTAVLNVVENKMRILTQHQDSSHEDRLQKYLTLRLTI